MTHKNKTNAYASIGIFLGAIFVILASNISSKLIQEIIIATGFFVGILSIGCLIAPDTFEKTFNDIINIFQKSNKSRKKEINMRNGKDPINKKWFYNPWLIAIVGTLIAEIIKQIIIPIIFGK